MTYWSIVRRLALILWLALAIVFAALRHVHAVRRRRRVRRQLRRWGIT